MTYETLTKMTSITKMTPKCDEGGKFIKKSQMVERKNQYLKWVTKISFSF